jgi:hypothetical protein
MISGRVADIIIAPIGFYERKRKLDLSRPRCQPEHSAKARCVHAELDITLWHPENASLSRKSGVRFAHDARAVLGRKREACRPLPKLGALSRDAFFCSAMAAASTRKSCMMAPFRIAAADITCHTEDRDAGKHSTRVRAERAKCGDDNSNVWLNCRGNAPV